MSKEKSATENPEDLNHEKHEGHEKGKDKFRDFRAFRGYKKYKPSGVEWLGDVPEHWDVKRTRFILRMNPSKQEINHLDPETELAFLPMEAVGEDGSLRLDSTRPISDVSAGYTYFAEGDVAFAKITPCFENGKGAILRNLGTGFGFGTTELTVMRPSEKLDAEYLYYITISDDFRHNGEAWMYGAGGQKRVPDEFVKEFRFGFPPLLEQQAIAAFLDRETGRIDALIAKKLRLLELLAEQRTALISRAVTKGLDASVKLKPSGVEWLGDVPEHWEVKKLKYVSNTKTGFAFSSDDYTDEGIPLIRIGDILQDGNIDIDNAKKLPEEYLREYRFVAVNKNDMLMAMTGATIGKAGKYQFETKGLLNQRVCKFVPFNTTNEYFWYILKSEQYAEHIKLTGFGGAQPNISDVQLLDFYFARPLLPEQQAIAAFLDCETAKIDRLSAKVATVIERLKEYRTALISSAVTGKIDVREKI